MFENVKKVKIFKYLKMLVIINATLPSSNNDAKHSAPGWGISEKVRFRKLKGMFVNRYDLQPEISTKK